MSEPRKSSSFSGGMAPAIIRPGPTGGAGRLVGAVMPRPPAR
jgi:hypothetical protein